MLQRAKSAPSKPPKLPVVPDMVVPSQPPRRPVLLTGEEPRKASVPSFDAELEVPRAPVWLGRARFDEDSPARDRASRLLSGPVPPRRPSSDDLLEGLRRRGLYDLADAIARYHRITVEEMMGNRRTATPVLARAQLIYVLKTYHHRSYPEIADIFGKDHTTIMAGLKSLPESARKEIEPVVRPFLRGGEDAPESAHQPVVAP